MVSQALHQCRTDMMVSCSGYLGGTDSNEIIEKYKYMNCAQKNPGIQRRVFHNWMNRVPELVKVPKVIVIHGKSDKCAAYSDMALFVDKLERHGGNVTLLTIPDNMSSKPNHHCCFWNNLEHRLLRDEFWTPAREHLLQHQFDGDCPSDPWVATDVAWKMPVRVAVDPESSDDEDEEPDDDEGPTGAFSSPSDANAQSDIEMSTEEKAEIQRSYEHMKEVVAKLAQRPADCIKAKQEVL